MDKLHLVVHARDGSCKRQDSDDEEGLRYCIMLNLINPISSKPQSTKKKPTIFQFIFQNQFETILNPTCITLTYNNITSVLSFNPNFVW